MAMTCCRTIAFRRVREHCISEELVNNVHQFNWTLPSLLSTLTVNHSNETFLAIDRD